LGKRSPHGSNAGQFGPVAWATILAASSAWERNAARLSARGGSSLDRFNSMAIAPSPAIAPAVSNMARISVISLAQGWDACSSALSRASIAILLARIVATVGLSPGRFSAAATSEAKAVS